MTFKGLSIGGIVVGIIGLVLAFKVSASLLPEVSSAGSEINATGLPLASLFSSNGVVILAVMAGLVLAVLGVLGFTKGKR